MVVVVTNKKRNSGSILIVQYSSNRDGSAFSGLLLADGFRNAGWQTHVAFGHAGPMEAEYQRSGHKTCVVEHNNWLRRSHPVRFLRDVLNEWQISLKFCGLLEQLHPHVVYINTAVSLAGAVAAKRKNVPRIWHLREQFRNAGGEVLPQGLLAPAQSPGQLERPSQVTQTPVRRGPRQGRHPGRLVRLRPNPFPMRRVPLRGLRSIL